MTEIVDQVDRADRAVRRQMRCRIVRKTPTVENRRGETVIIGNDPLRRRFQGGAEDRGSLGDAEDIDIVMPILGGSEVPRREADGGAGAVGETAAVLDGQRQRRR